MSSSGSFNDRTGGDGFFNPTFDNRPLNGSQGYNLENLDDITFDDNFNESVQAQDDAQLMDVIVKAYENVLSKKILES